jgi:hypothetical protein
LGCSTPQLKRSAGTGLRAVEPGLITFMASPFDALPISLRGELLGHLEQQAVIQDFGQIYDGAPAYPLGHVFEDVKQQLDSHLQITYEDPAVFLIPGGVGGYQEYQSFYASSRGHFLTGFFITDDDPQTAGLIAHYAPDILTLSIVCFSACLIQVIVLEKADRGKRTPLHRGRVKR